MNILVLGINGQVGWELSRALLPVGNLILLGRPDADLANPDRLQQVIRAHAPDVIVNAAAYTAVDRAESDSLAAMAVNATAPGILAEEARRAGALLIHYSTDYVFDGALDRPYREDDAPSPQNVYGRSKLAGEQAISKAGGDFLILRTSWVYGVHGQNFMHTMLRLAREREIMRVVDDQIGAPTWSRWIAEATADIVREAQRRRRSKQFTSGIYHLTCAGETSWHGFASAIISGYQALHPEEKLLVRDLEPIATSDYPTPAKRPHNSRLDCIRLREDYGIVAPDWRLALQRCLEDLPRPA